jgi:hypothetical protein
LTWQRLPFDLLQKEAMKAAIQKEHRELWDEEKKQLRRAKQGQPGYQQAVVASMRASWPELSWLLPSDIQNAKASFWKGGRHVPSLDGLGLLAVVVGWLLDVVKHVLSAAQWRAVRLPECW